MSERKTELSPLEPLKQPAAHWSHIGIYTRELWWEFCWAIAALLFGVLILAGVLIETNSRTIDALPNWVLVPWGIEFVLGGFLVARGVQSVKADIEAGGNAAIAAAFAVGFVISFTLSDVNAGGSIFYGAGALAAAGRVLFLKARGC